MITVITGEIDSGKTSRLLSIYESLKKGDGFILKKVFKGGINIGQDVIKLSSGETIPFSRKKNNIPLNWEEAYKFGSYSFSSSGLTFAESVINDALILNNNPIYIDEIGPLEIQNKGFSNILLAAISSNKNLFITVRGSCLQKVIKKFNICQFKIVKL